MHFNEKIAELTQSSETKKPKPSQLAKAKQLRSLKKKHRSARTANTFNCHVCNSRTKIAKEYSSGDLLVPGLPRPSMSTGETTTHKDIKENWPGKGMVHQRVPVPYGHYPEADLPTPARTLDVLSPEKDHICEWCGVKFEDPNEIVSRWKINNSDGSWPMHLKCMSQHRTFCTGARTAPDSAFETGPYSVLRPNAEKGLL